MLWGNAVCVDILKLNERDRLFLKNIKLCIIFVKFRFIPIFADKTGYNTLLVYLSRLLYNISIIPIRDPDEQSTVWLSYGSRNGLSSTCQIHTPDKMCVP